MCGDRRIDIHHILGKGAHPYLKYDPDNGIALCRVHHDKAHAERKWLEEVVMKTFGADRMSILVERAASLNGGGAPMSRIAMLMYALSEEYKDLIMRTATDIKRRTGHAWLLKGDTNRKAGS